MILNGNARYKQSSRAGIYKLDPEDVNGFPHWLQENGSNAIWFSHSRSDWKIGVKTDLGKITAGIAGPDQGFSYPTKIEKWYYYGNGAWTLTDLEEINFIGMCIFEIT